MNDNSEKQQEQEVDLVPVFVWIGNGFKNLFNGIANLFKGVAHFLILFLIFIKSNIILLAVLFLVGAGLGYYLDQESKKTFTAAVRVKPYFNSNAQLISNINFYNSLVQEQDFDRLAEELDIPIADVESIKTFTVEADFNDTELLREYDAASRTADSTALVNYTFKGYKSAKREIDYEFYIITVNGTQRDVLEKAAENAVIVRSNSAIRAQRTASIENVKFDISAMNYQLKELDSIIASYQKAIQKSKPMDTGTSTNLYLGDSNSSNSITELFDQKETLLKKLNTARLNKYYYENTINIVSSYVQKGAIEKPHLKIKLALVFLGLGLIIALVPVLWRFLNNYETKRSE
jgi:hypothetical protein